MSYCRWSSDDFQCDLYVYANVSGAWTIHVAGRRYKASPRRGPRIEIEGGAKVGKPTEESWAAHQAWTKANMEDIDLPHAGATFDTASPGDCADKCEDLGALGYRFPPRVVHDLRSEQAEMDAKGSAA